MDSQLSCQKNTLWPSQSDCPDQFDFSLLFEQSFLSLLPSSFLILTASFRAISLKSKPRRIRGRKFLLLKLFTLALYAALQLALLVVWCARRTETTKLSIPSAVISLINAIICCWLSYAEHNKSLRPSSILSIYFFFTLFFDGVQTRTLWLQGYSKSICGIFVTSLALKAVILVLEAWEKTPYLASTMEARSPEETSGIFNRSVFYWLNNILLSGYQKVVTIKDLYPLDEQTEAAVLHANIKKSWASVGDGWGQDRMLLAILRSHWPQLVLPIIPRLCLIGFTFCQPLLLNRTLDFLSQRDQSDTPDIGNGLIGAYAIVYLGLAVSTGFYWHKQLRCLTMIRGSIVAAIYQKTLEVTNSAASITLMSTDVERITTGMRYVHEIWSNIVEVCIGTWLLERELGVPCVAPVIVAAVCSLATVWVNSFAPKRQSAWMSALQRRVAVTAATLTSMKNIKMSGLTDKIFKLIQNMRIKEVQSARGFRIVMASNLCIAFTPQYISPVVTFAAYVAVLQGSHKAMNVSRTFTSLSLLVIMSKPLSQLFQLIPIFIAALGCLKRVQTFLVAPSQIDHRLRSSLQDNNSTTGVSSSSSNEQIELRHQNAFTSTTTKINNEYIFVVYNAAFGWADSEPVLHDISLEIPRSKLTLIIGPVASGKSTLCKALLGEAIIFRGSVQLNDEARLSQIAYCNQFPFLFNTSVRENILGFSAFDSAWYDLVVDAVGLTEDFKTLPSGDHTSVGSNGASLSGGQKQRVAIARAVYSKKQTVFFDDIMSGLDTTTEQLIFDKLLSPKGLLQKQGRTTVLFTHATKFLPTADHIIVLEKKDEVKQGTFQSLLKTSTYLQKAISVLSSPRASVPNTTNSVINSSPTPTAPSRATEKFLGPSRQKGDMKIYKYYFKAVGARHSMILFVFGIWLGFSSAFPTVWLSFWSDADTQGFDTNGRYLGIYALLQILGLVTFGGYLYHCLYTIPAKSGLQLHQTALQAVMSASTAWLSRTDTGLTTNRFSQDMELIDGELPQALMNLIMTMFTILGQAILIAIATPYVAVSFPALLAVFFFIQRFYLRTSRQLRILDLETKSPLYTHFLETSGGISTIRSFGWQSNCMERCYQRLNTSQQPYYLLFMIQQWLSLVLDVSTAILAIMVAALAVSLRRDSSFTGIALVNLVSFNASIRSIIVSWSIAETSIGAVSRIKQLEDDVTTEALPEETVLPPETWPERGSIDINGVTAVYDLSSSHHILTDINLNIRAGEKIGICGRTGSGKSTFLLSLFHMVELLRGSITIDNEDLRTLSRESLRTRLNAVPQEPFFLPGTVRLNLDPSESVPDSDIIVALQEVQLWDLIESQGGLSAEVRGDSLSQGQKQLFCFARALLRRRGGKVLILDEVSSSLDHETDALLQRLIRHRFAHHTIIAVAHRIETILDFDRVAVFSDGRIVEVGPPSVLRAKQGSAFRELCQGIR